MPVPVPQAAVRYVGPVGSLTAEGMQFLLATAREIEALTARTVLAEATVATLQAAVTALENALDAAELRIDALEATVDDHETRIAALEP